MSTSPAATSSPTETVTRRTAPGRGACIEPGASSATGGRSRGTSVSTTEPERAVEVDDVADGVDRSRARRGRRARRVIDAAVDLARRRRRPASPSSVTAACPCGPVIATTWGVAAQQVGPRLVRRARRCATPAGMPARLRRRPRVARGAARSPRARSACASSASRAAAVSVAGACRSRKPVSVRPARNSSLAEDPDEQVAVRRHAVEPRAAQRARRAAAPRPRASAPTRSPWRASRRSSWRRPSPSRSRRRRARRRRRSSSKRSRRPESGRKPSSGSSA